ncbi:MAG: acriflavin resistance protein [Gammaproteobacteria bacterium]|nr:acriflavin resistance protein [Gammaproteobacteria bacterium]
MSLFYRNPRVSGLLVLFVLLFGLVALGGLARQEDPTMTERYASVSTFLPGATANRVESLISEPLETGLREIPEIRVMGSKSRAGYSLLDIELYDHVGPGETDTVWSEIRDKLGEIHPNLPPGTSVPLLEKRAPIAATLVVGLSWEQPGEPELTILTRLAKSLEIRLANLPNTRETDVFGEAQEAVLVTVDPYRLSNTGLSAADVAARIAAADTKRAAGRLRHPGADVLVEVDAELDSPERIARIPLKSGRDGAVLRVSDVAEVEKRPQDPPATLAFHGARRTVMVMAKMEPDQQIGAWVDGALATVDAFRDRLPAGVGLEVYYNQNDYTGERMQTLVINLVSALVIVMATLVWFMGVRSALTVGIALPLSGAMVLAAMYVMDIPLHQMSVTGLIISLGLLIDNAIVVVEDYKLSRRRGYDIAPAIDRSVRHLAVPLGASTATTVFAFMTIAMAPGGVGDFTGTIGISVVLAVISSYLLAMSVVPAVAGFAERLWPSAAGADGARWWRHGYSSPTLAGAYRRGLARVLVRPWAALAIGCALPLAGFLLAPTLTQQFFPPVDRNQFQVQISLPAQASIWETRDAVATAERILRAHPDVRDTYWSVGEGAPRTYYNVMTLNDGVASFAGGWVDTTSPEATRAMLPALQRDLSEALPQAQVLTLPFEQGPPFEAPIEIRVVGPELDTLRRISDELRLLLSELDHVTYTRASLSAAEPKLVFTPDENPAAAAGLATGDLTGRLNDALSGARAGTVQEGNTELPVRVRLADARRDEVHELTALPLVGGSGGMVPMEAIGTWQVAPAASGIERYQGSRISSVQAYLEPFVLPAGVMAEFRQRLEAAGLSLPAGYRLDIGGEEEERSESLGGLMRVFVMFAAAMAAVVILSLNSFRHGALIGLVGFLSFGLALFGVRLFGYPLGFQAIIGGLGMVGLAINGALIVLSALKADPGARAGDPGATVDVVMDATRHIVSTTVTTMGGFVPLIVFGGTFWPPLATAIAGGVGGSAIIALVTVPAVHLALAGRRQHRLAAAGSGSVEALEPPEPVRRVAH